MIKLFKKLFEFKMNVMQNEAFEKYMSYHNSRENYE